MSKISYYHKILIKCFLDYLLIVLAFPLVALIFITISFVLIKTSGFSIFYIQNRTGKNGKVFKMYKFRTMVKGADKMQSKYKNLNEADGPVFKIRNDPRYTKFGKFLSRTGLDELPQIINVLKGEMSLVGPRPLPVYEAKKLTKAQNIRLLVKPGITSSWIANGHHKHKFADWMQLDKVYVQNASLITDINILYKTVLIPIRYILQLFN